MAVPDFADLVAVDLLESVLRGAEPAPDPQGGAAVGPLRRAGHRSVDEGDPGAAVGIGAPAVYLPGSPPLRALATGRPWRETRLDPAGAWTSRGPGDRAAAGPDPGAHSVLVVPLRARGVTLGIATFFRRHRQEPFDVDDVSLAEDLVSRAAVCVDNARRYTRERDAALVLQRSLLPRRLPEQDAVEVAACYRPADELTGLGGDWYDLIPLSGARVALVVGEVPGHGIGAAAAMGRLRTAVRTLAALDLPPDEVLAHLDDLVGRTDREEGAAVDPPPEQDARQVGSGCLYVVYDPVDGRCAMAAAGHPAPAVVLPDGDVRFVDLPQGPALGTGGPPFEAVELDLPDGSTLALHTDGLLARGGRGTPDADRDRLRRALERQADSLELRCRALIDALAPDQPNDDVALLMARTRRLDAAGSPSGRCRPTPRRWPTPAARRAAGWRSGAWRTWPSPWSWW